MNSIAALTKKKPKASKSSAPNKLLSSKENNSSKSSTPSDKSKDGNNENIPSQNVSSKSSEGISEEVVQSSPDKYSTNEDELVSPDAKQSPLRQKGVNGTRRYDQSDSSCASDQFTASFRSVSFPEEISKPCPTSPFKF